MKIRFAAILGALLALSIVVAQAAPAVESTPAPRPKKPDFAPFAFFVGKWSCTSKQANRPGPSTSTTTWTMDDTGYWMTATVDSPPVKWFPYETKSQIRLTYDADAKLWVYQYSDDVGGYLLATTPGWNGNTAVWTSRSFFPTKDTNAVSTYTMKKVSDSEYTGAYSFTNGKGTVVGSHDSCTKT